MRARARFGAALAFCTLVAVTGRYERRSARAYAHLSEDKVQLAALLAASTALETGLLELRAGLQLQFDDVNHAMRAFRSASPLASALRGRGPAYAEAADALERLANDARAEEPAFETAKSELALLRLSSRYFPIAADAFVRPDQSNTRRLRELCTDVTRSGDEPAGPLSRGIGSKPVAVQAFRREHEALSLRVGALRSAVELYEDGPSREMEQRLQSCIEDLDEAGATLDEALRSELGAMLGHARSILERRERVDRTVRALVRSPLRPEAEAAADAYNRAARQDYGMVVALRIAFAELAATALSAVAAWAWSARGHLKRN